MNKLAPNLSDYSVINDEKEKVLLELALGKYTFAVKYMKDSVYKDGVSQV